MRGKIGKSNPKSKTGTTRKRKKSDRQKAIEYADKYFSQYIRIRDHFVCITCGVKGSYRTSPPFLQNGHLISKYFFTTRYDERNCNCQCNKCNIKHEIDYEIYKRAFIDKYGEEVYDEIYTLANREPEKISPEEVRAIGDNFKGKIKQFGFDPY